MITKYSSSLGERITLTGEAEILYNYISKDHWDDNTSDPAYYPKLVELGYGYNTRHLFTRLYRIDVKDIVELGIKPQIADYATYTIYLNGSSRDTWLAQALPHTNIQKAIELERLGWEAHFAIIISAFPERETRLKECLDHGIDGYQEYIASGYNVAMLARLDSKQGNYPAGIIAALNAGYTETELSEYGPLAVSHFSPAEIRTSISKRSTFKAVFSAFKEPVYLVSLSRNRGEKITNFVPNVMQMDNLVSAGVKNGKQYKELGQMLNLKTSDPALATLIPNILNIVDYKTLQTIHETLGEIVIQELPIIKEILESGHALQEYFDVLASVKAEEEKMRP